MCNPNRYWCEDEVEMAAFGSFISFWICVLMFKCQVWEVKPKICNITYLPLYSIWLHHI